MVLTLVFVLFLSGYFRGILSLNCEAGEYEQDDICTPCPSPCTKCINNLICTECKPGFYGTTCEKQCSESCNERKCLQENGQCLSCVRGHYFGSNKSCVVCPGNCIECLSEDKCTSCKVGFKGDTCKEECINCRQGSGCTLETGVCISGCQDGYSGHSCLEFCNSKCQSCERIDAYKCTVCVEGRYGINCEKTCPAHCKNRKCNYDNRICTDGCTEGYWGVRCEHTCPKQCLRGICSRDNGLCSYGCRGNFTGSKCLCPDKCECTVEGFCEKCSNQSDYLCNNLCRTACVENICVRGVQTKCLYGYREGYDGSLCSLEFRPSHMIPAVIVLAIVAVCAPFVTIIIIRYQKRFRRHRSEEVPDVFLHTDVSKNSSKSDQDTFQNTDTEENEEPSAKTPMLRGERIYFPTRILRKAVEESLALLSRQDLEQGFQKICHSVGVESHKIVKCGHDFDALYINGFARKRAHIVCKAPTENKEEAFWKMVWKKQCDKIVHLSVDGVQSEDSQYKYWEKRNHWLKCGDVKVKPYVEGDSSFKEYYLTDIGLKKGKTLRWVTQLRHSVEITDQLTGDSGLAMLVNDVKEIESEIRGPLLVCTSSSKDASLCGIYIALDMMLEALETTQQVDVYELLSQLQGQMHKPIKSEDEYQFLLQTFLLLVNRMLDKRSPFWYNRKEFKE